MLFSLVLNGEVLKPFSGTRYAAASGLEGVAAWNREKNPQRGEEVIHSPEVAGGLAQCFRGHAHEGGPGGTWSPGQNSWASAQG